MSNATNDYLQEASWDNFCDLYAVSTSFKKLVIQAKTIADIDNTMILCEAVWHNDPDLYCQDLRTAIEAFIEFHITKLKLTDLNSKE